MITFVLAPQSKKAELRPLCLVFHVLSRSPPAVQRHASEAKWEV